ncbi:hypothetical protein A9O67_11395 [Tepidimonas fonticaldi]|uniref:Glycosyltransferase 2-like domain-containing protein n=1 Tax=Tepidimonas fonticaldi TaxID=1101373 RepID=A0A1A6DZ13_9BURK|nr:glycosyltransferase [Tepidimonas fonticaldi]OBS31916.1 hypothetical protein A9O67_11395 [Tepidimonas fonticaldi]
MASTPVAVIVPVYQGRDWVQRCLHSVAAAVNRTPWRLWVIDDASPDPELQHWLRSWVAVQKVPVEYQRNAVNQGFVRTVNQGMAQVRGADVVLLNSDTEVSDGWLDRLRAAVRREPDIGTATPWSNNATIFSFPAYPQGGPLPAGLGVHDMAAACAAVLSGQSVDVPTAHGFCMYIRAECLAQTGLFDADAFGRGYGEENDFCLRAAARGWRHVHALDAYVYHRGSVSFGDERAALAAHAIAVIRQRYPGYDEQVQAYLRADPTRPARLRLEDFLASRTHPTTVEGGAAAADESPWWRRLSQGWRRVWGIRP